MSDASGAAEVLRHALSHPPRLRATRVVCLDGPSGSGKTTLAHTLRTAPVPVRVLSTDELLPGGWSGLPGLSARTRSLLGALAAGREGRWQRWDWGAGRWADPPRPRVTAGGVLVLEGTGSWHPSYAALVTTLVWVDAPRGLRVARGLARGDGMAEHGRRWRVAEDALHRASRTREHADVRLRT